MEVHPSFSFVGETGKERIHQRAFAAPYSTMQIQTSWRLMSLRGEGPRNQSSRALLKRDERLMQGLQMLYRTRLSRIRLEAILLSKLCIPVRWSL
jgi:hypothetical protein